MPHAHPSLGALLSLVVATCTFASTDASAAPVPADPTEALLRDAYGHENDPAYLTCVLTDFDVRLKGMKPPRAIDDYAHGWLLSHTGKGVDGVAAYDRAFAADQTMADAAYNAGVVLGDLGHHKEALAHFEAALKADPKHVDAAYNGAQASYDLKNYKRVLEL